MSILRTYGEEPVPLQPFGTYCMMAGHAERDCPERPGHRTAEHIELMRQGFGISKVPGPTLAEIREETRVDRELMLDEFHGRDCE